MSGYTKLFSSILASTVWREDTVTRIVWITLLAMADKNGVAEGSVPGLADFARVSVEDARKALERLSAPDADSRSLEHDGRRIAKIDGGWQILNHAKYRNKMSADERREYQRLKQAEYRKRKQPSTNVDSVPPQFTHTEAEADTDTKAERKNDVPPSRPLISGEANPRTWGKIHGDHVVGFCDWVCLPSFIYNEFARKSSDILSVQGWAEQVRREWQGKDIGDNLKFWRARWDESHPQAAVKSNKPRPIADILAERERKTS